MRIDWFTFTAQIINFLVLVWLLKRFLYGPIIRAMDERERRMIEQEQQAKAAKAQAEQAEQEHRRKQQEMEHAREQLLAQAGREIERWKKGHLEQARSEVEQTRTDWLRAVENERATFLRDLQARTGKQVYEICRRVLSTLSNVSMEERVIDAFLDRLNHIDDDKRRAIAASIRNSHPRIRVETALKLSEANRERIRDSISKVITNGAEFEFADSPELICGIELRAAGHKVAWSVSEMLQQLEEEFSKAIDQSLPH